MLDVGKIFRLFLIFGMIVSFIPWFISHAPSKKNKSIKRNKLRKVSTIGVITLTAITLIFCEQFNTKTFSFLISIILLHISFNMIIENL